ncbi:MAG TPA: hypothetical protein DD638_08540 [Pasteurellaceae bacterium]|nr:hypothetical protein [Pasteurellaceae bacterium]
MNSIQYLASMLLGLYMFILMLRMWFQYCKVDFYNSISQNIVKITDPVLMPIRKTIPTIKNIDLASLLFIFVLGFIKLPLLAILGGGWSSEIITQGWFIYLLFGLLSIVRVFGETILYIIFLGAILSWFNRGNEPFSYLLYQLGEPLLSPIRKFMPKTGMIDFSPMLLAFALFFINRIMHDLFPSIWPLV